MIPLNEYGEYMPVCDAYLRNECHMIGSCTKIEHFDKHLTRETTMNQPSALLEAPVRTVRDGAIYQLDENGQAFVLKKFVSKDLMEYFGEGTKAVGATEFMAFWKSLDDEQKAYYRDAYLNIVLASL